jgi:hypothetical protein
MVHIASIFSLGGALSLVSLPFLADLHFSSMHTCSTEQLKLLDLTPFLPTRCQYSLTSLVTMHLLCCGAGSGFFLLQFN